MVIFTAVLVEHGGLWSLLSQERGKNKTEKVICAGEWWGSPYSIYGAYNLSTLRPQYLPGGGQLESGGEGRLFSILCCKSACR